MKKILLTLVGIVCSLGMWAEDEILFSMTSPTGPTTSVSTKTSVELEATFSGGSAIIYNAKSSGQTMVTENDGVKISGSGSSYLCITLSGKTFAKGDYIQISTKNTFKITSTDSNSEAPTTDSNGKYTIPEGSSLIGQSSVYIWKDGGGAFKSVTIVRPDPTRISTDATLSAITYNGTAIADFSASTTSYNVTLAYGTETIPTVAATTTDGSAKTSITQATALPGKATVVVTAQDNTTKKTYEVNFSLSETAPTIPSGYTKLWRAQDWDNLTASKTTTTVNGLSIYDVAVDKCSFTDEELGGTLTKRFNFGGTGAVNGRRIEIPVTEPCEIVVWGASGSKERSITLSDGSNTLATLCTTTDDNKNTVIKESYNYTGGEGTIYAYSTTNGYYVLAVGIAPPAKTPSDIAPSSETLTVEKPKTATVSYTTSSTGAVTVTSSDPSVATVSDNNGTLTITGVEGGEAIIKISQAGDDNYGPGEATITVTVNDRYAPTKLFSADVAATAKVSYDAGVSKQELTAEQATVSGGTWAVSNGQTSAKELIAKQGSDLYFTMTNGNTFFTASLANEDTIMVGDIIKATMSAKDRGLKFGVEDAWGEKNPGEASATTSFSYTVKSGDAIVGKNSFNVFRATSNSTYFKDFAIYRPTQGIVTTTAAGVASYVTPYDLDFSKVEGLKAYVATAVSDDAITLAEVEKVPENTPIVVRGTASTTYAIPVTYDEPYVNTNEFIYAGEGGYKVASNECIYALNIDGQFQKVAAGVEVPAGKAVIRVSKSSAKDVLTLNFGDGSATAISNINAASTANANAYNIAGQRVNSDAKGIVIVNGRKFINK